MPSTKVSVCVPTYNVAGTIEKCLTHILNQTVKPNEILVVDGYSEDATLEILKKYPNVKIVGFAKGIGKARKILANEAAGDIVAWVDADILVPSNWLELHLRIREENKHIMILSGEWQASTEVSRKYVSQEEAASQVLCEKKPIHKYVGITQAACTMKKEVFSVINYDERFKRGEEWDLIISAYRVGIPSHYCSGLYFFHTNQTMKKNLKDKMGLGNYLDFLRKYGLWYIKFNPRHFLGFIFRIALVYAIPISLIFPYALLIYPTAWCAYSISNRKLMSWRWLLGEIMKGIGEHLHLLKLI